MKNKWEMYNQDCHLNRESLGEEKKGKDFYHHKFEKITELWKEFQTEVTIEILEERAIYFRKI
jgi:hypothetical protein